MTELPWVLAALAAAVVAIIFGAGLGVPRQRPAGVRGTILRWGHAAVWLFLGAMFLAIGAGKAAEPLVAPLGLLALGTYVSFLATLFGSARR